MKKLLLIGMAFFIMVFLSGVPNHAIAAITYYTVQLTNNSYDDFVLSFNNSGQVVWFGYDGTDWEVFLYSLSLYKFLLSMLPEFSLVVFLFPVLWMKGRILLIYNFLASFSVLFAPFGVGVASFSVKALFFIRKLKLSAPFINALDFFG